LKLELDLRVKWQHLLAELWQQGQEIFSCPKFPVWLWCPPSLLCNEYRELFLQV